MVPRGVLGEGLGITALSPRDPSVTATRAGWSGAPPTGCGGKCSEQPLCLHFHAGKTEAEESIRNI